MATEFQKKQAEYQTVPGVEGSIRYIKDTFKLTCEALPDGEITKGMYENVFLGSFINVLEQAIGPCRAIANPGSKLKPDPYILELRQSTKEALREINDTKVISGASSFKIRDLALHRFVEVWGNFVVAKPEDKPKLYAALVSHPAIALSPELLAKMQASPTISAELNTAPKESAETKAKLTVGELADLQKLIADNGGNSKWLDNEYALRDYLSGVGFYRDNAPRKIDLSGPLALVDYIGNLKTNLRYSSILQNDYPNLTDQRLDEIVEIIVMATEITRDPLFEGYINALSTFRVYALRPAEGLSYPNLLSQIQIYKNSIDSYAVMDPDTANDLSMRVATDLGAVRDYIIAQEINAPKTINGMNLDTEYSERLKAALDAFFDTEKEKVEEAQETLGKSKTEKEDEVMEPENLSYWKEIWIKAGVQDKQAGIIN